MKPDNHVKINCSEIPSVEMRNFCRTFSKAIERSAEDPSFLKMYEQYKTSKEVEKSHNEEASVCDSVACVVGSAVVCNGVSRE